MTQAIPKIEDDKEMTNEQHNDIVFLVDLMQRILARRNLEVGVNVLISSIHGLASGQPQEVREFICNCLRIVAGDIMNMKSELDTEPQAKAH